MNEALEAFVAAERSGDRHEPDLRVLLVRGVTRSFGWFCLLVALGAGAGIVVGLVRPDTFVSKAKLLLRVGAREQLTAESMFGLQEGQRTPPPTVVDELEMLSDVNVFESVAREIGPREILRPADPGRDDGPLTPLPVRLLHRIQAVGIDWMTPEHECTSEDCAECLRSATKVLIENTDVTNEPGSNVIHVAHASTSPERARAVAVALTDAFIERHREQFSVQSLVEKNRSKVEEAKRARDAADALYLQDLNQVGYIDLAAQGPALQVEIGELEGELFAARMRREEISRQRTSLSERLTGIPPEIEVLQPPEMVPNEEYETQLDVKRSLLAQKYSVPLEIRAKEEIRLRERELDVMIAKIDEKLAQTPRTVAHTSKMGARAPLAVAQTRERRDIALMLRLDDLDFEDQGLAVRVELLGDRLAERRTHAEEVRKKGLVAALRRKDLASAREEEENRYQHLLERFSMLESLESIDLNEEANLSVLQMPTLDLEKVGPKRLSLFLKGLIAGLLAGAGFAVLRQGFDRKLRDPEAFERSRGLPILGVVPELHSLRVPYESAPGLGRSSARHAGRWN